MEKENSFFDFGFVIKFIVKWWKHFLIVFVIAALAGVIFSSPIFITPMYQSGTTMFPTTTHSISRTVINPNLDFLGFGDIEDAERLLQVLSSGKLLAKVADEFNLMEHYGYKNEGVASNQSFISKFASNVSSRRTRFGAVEVSVRDKDPVMAAKIANGIASSIDTLMYEMRLNRALQANDIISKNIEIEKERMRLFRDSLDRIGVLSIDQQANMLSRQLAIDLSRNYSPGVKAIDERLAEVGSNAVDQIYYRAQIEHLSHNIANLERRLLEKISDLENPMQYKFVLDEASPPKTKIYPVRWIIVVLSVLGAGLTCLVFLMAYEVLQSRGILSHIRESFKKEMASK